MDKSITQVLCHVLCCTNSSINKYSLLWPKPFAIRSMFRETKCLHRLLAIILFFFVCLCMWNDIPLVVGIIWYVEAFSKAVPDQHQYQVYMLSRRKLPGEWLGRWLLGPRKRIRKERQKSF